MGRHILRAASNLDPPPSERTYRMPLVTYMKSCEVAVELLEMRNACCPWIFPIQQSKGILLAALRQAAITLSTPVKRRHLYLATAIAVSGESPQPHRSLGHWCKLSFCLRTWRQRSRSWSITAPLSLLARQEQQSLPCCFMSLLMMD
jgi:hypothetical protein